MSIVRPDARQRAIRRWPKQYVSTDDLALAVDGAGARVAKRDEQMGGFIGLYFDAKWPALRIARAHRRRKAKARNLALAAQLYEQAAKECGDMYVNRKIELNKPLGSQADQQHAVAEYAGARRECPDYPFL